MKTLLILLCGSYYLITSTLLTETAELKSSIVDFEGFVVESEEAMEYRKDRLIDFETFLKYSEEEGVIVLDTRSKNAYDNKHLKGSTHLNFSDFTTKKLAQVIPSKDTKILIYCNNNIDGDAKNYPAKKATMALNIPTFINLYAYGYKNIYELSSLVPVDYNKIEFEGNVVP